MATVSLPSKISLASVGFDWRSRDVRPADLGMAAGLVTDASARVLDAQRGASGD